MKKLVVLSGAGISQESGIRTFRDEGGLWENHRVEDIASIEGFRKNPEMVLEFYNLRRKQLHEVRPNAAHELLAKLEENWEVHIITQNVDNLHEKAGSTRVIHLHGELFKARPVDGENPVLPWEKNLHMGDVDERGVQLRPHIVWFGEDVPEMQRAYEVLEDLDCFLVIGTSLQVYPAASLAFEIPSDAPFFLIDPQPLPFVGREVYHFQTTATKGMELLYKELMELK